MRVTCDRSHSAVWRLRLEDGGGGQTLLDPEGVARLATLVAEAEASNACRVLVLEGQAGSFCQGLDLALAARLPVDQLSRDAEAFSRCLLRLRESDKVVIAAVDGAAVGGGVGLVAVADLVLATQSSTFGLPELVLGLLPALILPALLHRLSPQRLRLLALSPSLDASEARHLGLVDRVVADSATLDRQLRAAIKHVLRASPEGVARFKALFEEMTKEPGREVFDQAWRQAVKIMNDPAARHAIRAYLEGETPPWFDRYRPPGGADDAS